MQSPYEIAGVLILLFGFFSTVYTFFRKNKGESYRQYFLFFFFFTLYGAFILIPPLYLQDYMDFWGFFYSGAVFCVLMCAFSVMQTTLRLTIKNPKIISALNYIFIAYAVALAILHNYYVEFPQFYPDYGFVVWSRNQLLAVLVKIPLWIVSIAVAVRFAVSIFYVEGAFFKLRSFLFSIAALFFIPAIYFFFGATDPQKALIASLLTASGAAIFFIGNVIRKPL